MKFQAFAKVRPALLLAAFSMLGCGPQKQTETPKDVGSCPDGQRFDGTFCVVDPEAGAGVGGNASGLATGGAPASGGASAVAGSPSMGGGLSASSGGAGVAPSGGASAVGGAPSQAAPSFAAPVDITMAAAAGPWIQAVAATHLPVGAQPFGAPFAGQFQEGQVLRQRLELTVGRCYTILAAAPPPVRELRVGLYAVDPLHAETWLVPPLLEESEPGPQAVLGRKDGCFRPSAEQTNVWLLLFVDAGHGVAAAQVFQK